jgi:hypothetical protein
MFDKSTQNAQKLIYFSSSQQQQQMIAQVSQPQNRRLNTNSIWKEWMGKKNTSR